MYVLSSVILCLTTIEFWHPIGTALVDSCTMSSDQSCDFVVAEYSEAEKFGVIVCVY